MTTTLLIAAVRPTDIPVTTALAMLGLGIVLLAVGVYFYRHPDKSLRTATEDWRGRINEGPLPKSLGYACAWIGTGLIISCIGGLLLHVVLWVGQILVYAGVPFLGLGFIGIVYLPRFLVPRQYAKERATVVGLLYLIFIKAPFLVIRDFLLGPSEPRATADIPPDPRQHTHPHSDSHTHTNPR